jgi:phage-Barnase-EndoU-ColicinE5/D-RelE like nuclease2
MKEINSNKFTLFQMAMLIDGWKNQYHTDSHHNIIFQNKELLTNVIFPSDYLHKNHSINRGFANLPEAIINPDEVWSFWRDPDPKHQKEVIRNYILQGDSLYYVVTTLLGVIQKAQIVVPSRIDRYRKGLIILKK